MRRRIPSFSSSSPETETMRRRIYYSSSSSPSLSPCPRRERSPGNVGGGREPVIPDENETLAKKEAVAASEAKRCFDGQHPINAPLPDGTETEPGKKPRCSSSASRKADSFVGAAGRQPFLGKLKRRSSSSSSSSSLYPTRKRSSGNIGGGGEGAILGEGEKETAAKAQRTMGCSDEPHRIDSPLPTERGQADTLGTAASGDRVAKPLGGALPSFAPSSPWRSQGSLIKSQGSSSSASCRAVVSGNEEGRGPFLGEPKRRTSSSLSSSPPSSPSPSPPPCRSRKRPPGNAGGEGGRVIPGARESMWRTPSFSFSSSSPPPSPSRPLSPCPRMNESSSNVGGDGERVGLRIRVTTQGRISCSFSPSSSLCPMKKRSSGNVGGGGQAVVPGERDDEEEEEESVAKKNQTVATKRVASCFDDHQQIGAPLPIGPAAVAEAEPGGKPRPSSSASLKTDYFIDEEGPGSSSGMLKRMDPYSSSSSPPPYPRRKRSSCNIGGEREGVVLSERGDETAAKNTAVAAKTASCSDDPQPPVDVGNQSSGNVGGGGEAVLPGEREKETAAVKKRAVAAKKTVGCSGGQDPIDAPLPIGTETEPGGKRRSASSASRRADSFVDEGGGVSSSDMLKGGTSSSPRCPTRKRWLSKVGGGGERVVSGQREKETMATVKKMVGCFDSEHAVGAPLPTERGQADALGPAVSGDRAAVSLGGASPRVSPPCPRRNQESPRPSQGPSSSASRRADPFVDEDWYEGWTGLGPLSGKRKKMISSSFSPSPSPSSQPFPKRKRSLGNSVGGVGERVTPGGRGRGRVGVGAGGVRTTASPRTNTATNTATATAANIGTPNTATAARGNSRLASVGSAVPATGRVTTPSASASCRRGTITSDMTAYQVVEVIKRVVAPEDMPALFGHVLCLQPQHVSYCLGTVSGGRAIW